VWNNADGNVRPGITHHVLESAAMEREVGYNVYLPPGYETGELRYPVLYFLHGMGGNENSDGPGFCGYVSKLIESGEVPPVICVFPNGGASGYRDHPETKIMVETMIIKELIPLIDSTYRTRANRDSRMIAGYSMGSGGSARLALVYPELFCPTAGWGLSFTGRNVDQPLRDEFKPEALNRTGDRVRILMIIGLEDPGLAGYGPALAALTAAKYSFTYRTLENVPHNLGLYYKLTGEQVVRFLMEDIAPPSGP
jgi:endo-1,4-beta-xylanase